MDLSWVGVHARQGVGGGDRQSFQGGVRGGDDRGLEHREFPRRNEFPRDNTGEGCSEIRPVFKHEDSIGSGGKHAGSNAICGSSTTPTHGARILMGDFDRGVHPLDLEPRLDVSFRQDGGGDDEHGELNGGSKHIRLSPSNCMLQKLHISHASHTWSGLTEQSSVSLPPLFMFLLILLQHQKSRHNLHRIGIVGHYSYLHSYNPQGIFNKSTHSQYLPEDVDAAITKENQPTLCLIGMAHTINHLHYFFRSFSKNPLQPSLDFHLVSREYIRAMNLLFQIDVDRQVEHLCLSL